MTFNFSDIMNLIFTIFAFVYPNEKKLTLKAQDFHTNFDRGPSALALLVYTALKYCIEKHRKLVLRAHRLLLKSHCLSKLF